MFLLLSSSCKNAFSGTGDFQEVDFKDGQKVLLVMGDEVYNLFITFDENGEFTLKYLPEALEMLLKTTVTVNGEQAKIVFDGLEFTKNINDFNNSFVPEVVYFFFKNTSFEKENFIFDNEENTMILTTNILEKNVVFTVQLTQDMQSQIYLLEIR